MIEFFWEVDYNSSQVIPLWKLVPELVKLKFGELWWSWTSDEQWSAPRESRWAARFKVLESLFFFSSISGNSPSTVLSWLNSKSKSPHVSWWEGFKIHSRSSFPLTCPAFTLNRSDRSQFQCHSVSSKLFDTERRRCLCTRAQHTPLISLLTTANGFFLFW